MTTRNIVWQTALGVAITVLAPGEDRSSEDVAAAMLASGAAAGDWSPVRYDIELTEDQLRNPGRWLWSNGSLQPSMEAERAEVWARLKGLAQAELNASDMVALRCFKAAIAFPSDWGAYVEQLRNIVRAKANGPAPEIPQQPEFPPGT